MYVCSSSLGPIQILPRSIREMAGAALVRIGGIRPNPSIFDHLEKEF